MSLFGVILFTRFYIEYYNIIINTFLIICLGLKIAFDLADKLNIQSLSLDLIIDNNQFKITEMSYAFPIYAYDDSQGYWDRELNWHEGSYVPQYWMLENFLNEIAEIKK